MILAIAALGLLIALAFIISGLRKNRKQDDPTSDSAEEGVDADDGGFIVNPDGSLSSPHEVDQAFLSSAGRSEFTLTSLPSGLTTPAEPHVAINGRLLPKAHPGAAPAPAEIEKIQTRNAPQRRAEERRHAELVAAARSERRGAADSPFDVVTNPLHPASPLHAVHDDPEPVRHSPSFQAPRSEERPAHRADAVDHQAPTGNSGSSTDDSSSNSSGGE